MDDCGRPLDGPVVLVHGQRSGSWRQDFEGLEELDNRSLIIGIQAGEHGLARLGFARVRHDGFPNRGELSVMKMIRAGTDAPQTLGEEILIPPEESWRSGRLILIDRFYIGVSRSAANVVQLEIGICGHTDHTVDRRQTRTWQEPIRQIHGEDGAIAGP